MLTGKTIVLGVTGSIAAYKSASLASALVKEHADVHVIMTRNAVNFINPITFETLTHNKCITDTFDRNFEFDVKHISLAKKADLFMIAPATANIIGKLASGIADDMLSTTVMAAKCPVVLAPAMNTAMYDNSIVQENMNKLRMHGYTVIEPSDGYLACGDTGRGKMPEPEYLKDIILHEISHEKDLAGRRVLVTAGPTQEALDPVRFLSNHSSGKMGYAIASQAARRGAEVTLVSGRTSLDCPYGVTRIDVTSAADMFRAVTSHAEEADIIVMAAAVADYRPASVSDNKIKKKDGAMSIELERTSDIIGTLGAGRRDDQFLCGFSMETENLIENSRSKLERKNLDMIVANNLKVEGAGFRGDTNVAVLIKKSQVKELQLMSKIELADVILDEILCEITDHA
ncbi:MAG: bifunctional phosphopantothenoylcysteine decarboxylase/phosphopantothenate--cysteine ligase CoaBC [Firmicutes bacterium]|nr:bifunctional phosphopantothenoylcysteine decarboxylase/phosphopantothenate--cysteine ligase CoaBC [Bacillota bacterium]